MESHVRYWTVLEMLLFLWIYLLIISEGVRMTCGMAQVWKAEDNWFSRSSMWILKVEFRLFDSQHFTNWVILMDHK